MLRHLLVCPERLLRAVLAEGGVGAHLKAGLGVRVRARARVTVGIRVRVRVRVRVQVRVRVRVKVSARTTLALEGSEEARRARVFSLPG